MNQSPIIQHLFQVSTLEDVSQERLKSFWEEYPCYGFGHYLLSYKLKAESSGGYLEETHRTSLYFSNPFWLQWLLENRAEAGGSRTNGAVAAHAPAPVEAVPVETVPIEVVPVETFALEAVPVEEPPVQTEVTEEEARLLKAQAPTPDLEGEVAEAHIDGGEPAAEAHIADAEPEPVANLHTEDVARM